MPGTAVPKSARRHRVGLLAMGALSLIAGAYASACVIRSLVAPASPPDAPLQGPLAGLLTLYVPASLWHVLALATDAVASAGLVAAGMGLLLASRRALRVGLWSLLPGLASRVLLVPGRVALIVYPAGVTPAASSLDPRIFRQVSVLVSVASIAYIVVYLVYLLWLRRELRKLGT